jgi:hypothetical protein
MTLGELVVPWKLDPPNELGVCYRATSAACLALDRADITHIVVPELPGDSGRRRPPERCRSASSNAQARREFLRTPNTWLVTSGREDILGQLLRRDRICGNYLLSLPGDRAPASLCDSTDEDLDTIRRQNQSIGHCCAIRV